MTHVFRPFALLLLITVLSGCASPLYYAQAISGQLEILAKRRPVEEVLADPATPPETRRQLELVRRLREFASRELLLPDNRSYRSYADLERPFAVWNVLATPELSLQPKKWCFIVAGCVPYRGHFAHDEAERFAAKLKQKGYDVYIGGVPAYSTLGWFNDPLLNTFIHRSEADLAGLLFHELAHQKIYVSGDSAFNESFATVIELQGVKRWFERQGTAQQTQAYQQKIERRELFTSLVLKHRARLGEIYASNLDDEEKRSAKARVFVDLKHDYETLKAAGGNDTTFDGWFKQDINNAHVLVIGLYTQYVAAFRKLLAHHGEDLPAFYLAVTELARQPISERDGTLLELSAVSMFHPPVERLR